MTLDEAYVRFVEALAERHYAPATRTAYRDHLRAFLRWLGPDAGTRAVPSIGRADVERYQEMLVGSALAKETQALRIRALKRWFEWLEERGILFQSPAHRIVETPAGRRKLPRVLTAAEVERMLAVPNPSLRRGVRDRAMLEVLYATGVRRGELVALDVFDVDLDLGVARIRSGKGRKGRVVALTAESKRWLRTYLAEVRPRYEPHRRGERALFVDRQGRRISGEVVGNVVRAAAQGAGIASRVTVHSFRHAFATHLRQRGAPIGVIQKLLGHANPWITSEIYTRVVPSEVKAEHERTHPRERSFGAGPSSDKETP